MPASIDPVDLTDALLRWEAGTLAPSIATPDDVAEVRSLLEGAARVAAAAAAAGGADLASNPIRLSKRRLTDLLACERHLVLTTDQGSTSGPGDEALHLGVLIDVLAEHHVVDGCVTHRARAARHRPRAVHRARRRKADTVAWVDAARPRRPAHLRRAAGGEAGRPAGVVARLPDRRWWPRTQERMAVALADGDVVLSGHADVTVGGPPTPWPIALVEVKSGGFTMEQRDDGLVYALLLALRDGVAPAAAITVTAAGAVHVEAATADRLATAAERVGVAIVAAGELAGGRVPIERAGFRCERCPVERTCLTAAGRDRVEA